MIALRPTVALGDCAAVNVINDVSTDACRALRKNEDFIVERIDGVLTESFWGQLPELDHKRWMNVEVGLI